MYFITKNIIFPAEFFSSGIRRTPRIALRLPCFVNIFLCETIIAPLFSAYTVEARASGRCLDGLAGRFLLVFLFETKSSTEVCKEITDGELSKDNHDHFLHRGNVFSYLEPDDRIVQKK